MTAKVINLDTGVKRWEAVQKELVSFGIESFERFPAITEPDGLRGHGRSHVECIKSGVDIIFEDDVFFIPGAMSILIKAISQLPKDCDILYLGGNVEEPLARHSENLFRCTAAWCSHAILYSTKGRKFVLDNYDPTGPGFLIYDVFLRQRSKIDLQAYIVSPIIAWQVPGYSDINQREENYLPKMMQNEREFMV